MKKVKKEHICGGNYMFVHQFASSIDVIPEYIMAMQLAPALHI
jgi:hypothetical protein